MQTFKMPTLNPSSFNYDAPSYSKSFCSRGVRNVIVVKRDESPLHSKRKLFRLCDSTSERICIVQEDSISESRVTNITRHRASTSVYSLTFRVLVTTPPQYGWNGTAHAAGASILSRARGVFASMRSTWHCVRRAVGLADYRWALPRITNVAIATQPVHWLQIRPIVHNLVHPLPLPQVTSGSVQ